MGRLGVDQHGSRVVEPLEEYLAPVIRMLGPFETEKMRYAWRQWLYFPCNWKVALGRVQRELHVHASHPQLGRGMGIMAWWCQRGRAALLARPAGPARRCGKKMKGLSEARGEVGQDPRMAVANDLQMTWDTLRAVTTETASMPESGSRRNCPKARRCKKLAITCARRQGR